MNSPQTGKDITTEVERMRSGGMSHTEIVRGLSRLLGLPEPKASVVLAEIDAASELSRRQRLASIKLAVGALGIAFATFVLIRLPDIDDGHWLARIAGGEASLMALVCGVLVVSSALVWMGTTDRTRLKRQSEQRSGWFLAGMGLLVVAVPMTFVFLIAWVMESSKG